MMYRSRGGVRRLESLHRAVLPGLQGVDQLHILHNVSLLFLRMSYYTPEMAKSYKIFSAKLESIEKACPRSGEGGQSFVVKLSKGHSYNLSVVFHYIY